MSKPQLKNETTLTMIKAAKEASLVAIEHRVETESSRRLAPKVVDKLIEHGLYRIGLPKSLGGWEDNPVEVLKVYEILSNAEASAAWNAWNNHLACTFGRYLDNKTLNEVFGNPSHIYANSTRPEGFAKVVPGGYIVSGRWSLVSGCVLADWFALRCLVTEEGSPTKLGPGAKLKLLFLPKRAISVIDTWNVGGLRGTASHDVEVKDVFVEQRLAVNFDSDVQIDHAYSRLPIGCMNAAGCASMALGLVKKAVDELVKMGFERVTPGKNPDLRDRATVQTTVANGLTKISAVRTQLHNTVAVIWKESLDGNTFTDVQLADVWAAAYQAGTAARSLLTDVYAVAGTASLYTKSPIERAHRDIHALMQHGIIQPHWMNQAGMAYLGLTPTAPMFRI